MALESGSYISDLVITNPTATDLKSQGDDHLRLLKSTVKATFPNVSGAMTLTHTVMNALGIGKNICAYGAVGDGVTDNSAAIKNAQDAAAGTGTYVPPGTYLVSNSVVSTDKPNIYGPGKIKVTDATIAALTYTINTTHVEYWHINLEFEGPVTTNVLSAAIRFTGDDTALIQNGSARIVTNGFNAAVKDEKTARTTGAGLEAMLNWNKWDVTIESPGSYGFWLTQGSGTGNIFDGVIKPRLSGGSCMFFDGVGCVVGDVIISGHWGCEAAGGIGLKIGASTVYRAQWDFARLQFDSNCDTPISLSATGVISYKNFSIQANNLGGSTALGAGLRPLYSSIVQDRDTSRWEAGKAYDTATVGALSINAFTIDFAAFGAANIRVVTSGTLGGVGAKVGFAEFDIVEGSGSLTSTAVGSARGSFVISVTLSGTTATVKWAATSTFAGTSTNSTIQAVGHGFKISRA